VVTFAFITKLTNGILVAVEDQLFVLVSSGLRIVFSLSTEHFVSTEAPSSKDCKNI